MTPAGELRAAAARWRRTHPDDGLAHALADLLDFEADLHDRAPHTTVQPRLERTLTVAPLINQETT